MADPRGFLHTVRRDAPRRPVDERVRDWRGVEVPQPRPARDAEVREQAGRCMDCGIPFCHSSAVGCPLGNLVPEWTDLVHRGRWGAAAERLHATNNFPEFTGALCPAPCESACVLALGDPHTTGGVTIKRIERAIADHAWEDGRVTPERAGIDTGFRVAVVGSGPAGLAAAQQLTRAGHRVTVFEREDRLGGLLRYGIPAFKMPKSAIDRRIAQLRSEGTAFVTGCEVGVDLDVDRLRATHDAVVLAIGALDARETQVPGRELAGVHQAMEYLVAANREGEGDGATPVSAAGKRIVLVGGGDTGADCLGTAHRQGARSVIQLDYHAPPPTDRDESGTPWPLVPLVLHTSAAHEEGGERRYRVAVRRFVADAADAVRAVALAEVSVDRDRDGRRVVTPVGAEYEIPCDLALLAIGFEGVERGALLDGLGLSPDIHGRLRCGPDWQSGTPGVFVCGDAHRGASLVVWAIAEGRAVARAVDARLTGTSVLPAPVSSTALPLTAR
ncbi:glutamate synthase subunit beta [Rhodococcus triatomae]|uniref:Glutamate synthase (NADPH/NADH) small chain n=1 Tax=Rhodococcus triatomae TaxID=300028 RepID=A0A1G8CQF6_9NOCA|nr:glutamate synthase subunit beta [Rhodococcus triatomae]QNG18594.1 glutamate synthase subunit beta [Rhodococcus triatomae]QNG21737.1 glutamate synthase subunit beta [Rhodococcus triatomae]SDH47757.1 glutamate synthase (NADPH/NADH) small chain [Rhodococcus triatomae]